MLKRSVGNCVSTTIWFFCVAFFCAADTKVGAKLALSSNHGITTFEIGLPHKRKMLTTQAMLTTEMAKLMLLKDNVFCYYSTPGGLLKMDIQGAHKVRIPLY